MTALHQATVHRIRQATVHRPLTKTHRALVRKWSAYDTLRMQRAHGRFGELLAAGTN
jgi:hypothetical protein